MNLKPSDKKKKEDKYYKLGNKGGFGDRGTWTLTTYKVDGFSFY